MSVSKRACAAFLAVSLACAHAPPPSVAQLIAEGKEAQALELVRGSRSAPETDSGYAAALQNAAHAGNAELVTALLERGADPNLRYGAERTTPLHMALRRTTSRIYVDVARILLDHGADPRSVDVHGASPLHYLAGRPAHFTQSAKQAAVELLVERGAAADGADEEGWTALHSCAAEGDSDAVLGALVEHGANPGALGRSGLTPLDAAVATSQSTAVAFLFAHGATPHVLRSAPSWPKEDIELHREFEISGEAFAAFGDWQAERADSRAARAAYQSAEPQLALAIAEFQRATSALRSAATKASRPTSGEIGESVAYSAVGLTALALTGFAGFIALPDRAAGQERALPLNVQADRISAERAETQRILDRVRAALAIRAK